MADLAACLDCEAALLWDSGSDRAFEEAVFEEARARAPEGDLAGHCVTTVELRGQNDVDAALAQRMPKGFTASCRAVALSRLTRSPRRNSARGLSASRSEMSRWCWRLSEAPFCSMSRLANGSRQGQVVAEIIVNPGREGGTLSVRAPQAGFVLTRRIRRFIRMGDNLLKIIGDRPAVASRKGALED
jgi:predicted deacylase